MAPPQHSHLLQLLPDFHSTGPDFTLEVPEPSLETPEIELPSRHVVLNYAQGCPSPLPCIPSVLGGLAPQTSYPVPTWAP